MGYFKENETGLRELSLFSGAGGGILGGHLLGWRTVCAVEYNAYARSVLLARQNDGTIPTFPVWDDVRTFDGTVWKGRIDVVSGGFPCQDISSAGRGAGITGERSGLWGEMARIIGEVQPRYVFVENSPMLTKRGIHRVLGDLSEMGFDAKWGVVSAEDAGAPHQRKRIWIMGYHRNHGQASPKIERSIAEGSNHYSKWENTWFRDNGIEVPNPASFGQQGQGKHERPLYPEEDRHGEANRTIYQCETRCRWWESEPVLGRVAHGVAHRMDRLTAIGNGQVPIVAAAAWNILNNQ